MNNQEFKQYLINKRYKSKTVETRLRDVQLFFDWLKLQNINPAEVSYADLLAYVKFCRSRGNKLTTLKQKMKSVQLFYAFLVSQKQIPLNPCDDIKLRKGTKNIPSNILSIEELEELYEKIPADSPISKRNKVILSLMIYQGLETGAIRKLRQEDVKLEQGKLYVPPTKRGNSRTLDLKINQILLLQNYITNIRPYLLSQRLEKTELLFFSNGTGTQLTSVFNNLVKRLKSINPKVTGVKQIRVSVIVHWLSIYSLREVQYLAGHRYVSSTEHYCIDNLKNLQEQINNLHPLK